MFVYVCLDRERGWYEIFREKPVFDEKCGWLGGGCIDYLPPSDIPKYVRVAAATKGICRVRVSLKYHYVVTDEVKEEETCS